MIEALQNGKLVLMRNDLLTDVTDRKGFISPRKLSAVLHVYMKDVARLAAVHRNTLQRNPTAGAIQQRLGTVVRILMSATSITGHPSRAIIWFKYDPIDSLGGKTALELAQEGHADAVFSHLELVDNGVYS